MGSEQCCSETTTYGWTVRWPHKEHGESQVLVFDHTDAVLLLVATERSRLWGEVRDKAKREAGKWRIWIYFCIYAPASWRNSLWFWKGLIKSAQGAQMSVRAVTAALQHHGESISEPLQQMQEEWMFKPKFKGICQLGFVLWHWSVTETKVLPVIWLCINTCISNLERELIVNSKWSDPLVWPFEFLLCKSFFIVVLFMYFMYWKMWVQVRFILLLLLFRFTS